LYYRNRPFIPAYECFLSRDADGYAGGFNLLSYVNKNPITRIDPLGLQQKCIPRCGVDVTSIMSATMTNMRTAFMAWQSADLRDALSRCSELTQGYNGWDLPELKSGPTPIMTSINHGCATGKCSCTVRYQGNVTLKAMSTTWYLVLWQIFAMGQWKKQ
jgi:hypothetical protein